MVALFAAVVKNTYFFARASASVYIHIAATSLYHTFSLILYSYKLLTREIKLWEMVVLINAPYRTRCYRRLFCCRLQISTNGHPIGHGHDQPSAALEESMTLDHKSEAEHLASIVRDNAELKTSEEFKGLVVRKWARGIHRNSPPSNQLTICIRSWFELYRL